jgi:hypothetical protein
LALQGLSKYFFYKGYYLGVCMDEEKAMFEMEWQVQEKIDAKIKLISGQFNGDGSAFSVQQYFYIWRWTNGKVYFDKRAQFWKMGDAYSWYIEYCIQYLRRDASSEFLLIGGNTPMLSTASWSSEINKLMIGRAISQGSISMKSMWEGQTQQFWMLLMNRADKSFKLEPLGAGQDKAFKQFGTMCSGGSAEWWGVLFNTNGKLYKIIGDNSNKLYQGDYWGYWFITEYIMTEMKWWITWVHTEKEAGIVLKKEMAARAAADSEWRKSFATRIMRYG